MSNLDKFIREARERFSGIDDAADKHASEYYDKAIATITPAEYRHQLSPAIKNIYITGFLRSSARQKDLPRALEALEKMRDALKFYAGIDAKHAIWEKATLLTFDKFGGLCEQISGPKIALSALAEVEKILGGVNAIF